MPSSHYLSHYAIGIYRNRSFGCCFNSCTFREGSLQLSRCVFHRPSYRDCGCCTGFAIDFFLSSSSLCFRAGFFGFNWCSQLFFKLLPTNHLSSESKPAACRNSFRRLVGALQGRRLALCDEWFGKIDEAFIAYKNQVLELESPVPKHFQRKQCFDLRSSICKLASPQRVATSKLRAFCGFCSMSAQLDALWQKTIENKSGWIVNCSRRYASSTCHRVVFHSSCGLRAALKKTRSKFGYFMSLGSLARPPGQWPRECFG